MSWPRLTGPAWLAQLKAMKATEVERARLAKSEAARARAFAGNFNDLHIRSNKERRIH